jgi:hypothetical protein
VGIGLVTVLVGAYGSARYHEGYAKAEAEFTQRLNDALKQASEAQQALASLQQERQAESNRREEVRTVVVTETREEIINAEDSQARYAAYLSGRERLRGAAAEHFNRARSDYMSSIAAAR